MIKCVNIFNWELILDHKDVIVGIDSSVLISTSFEGKTCNVSTLNQIKLLKDQERNANYGVDRKDGSENGFGDRAC